MAPDVDLCRLPEAVFRLCASRVRLCASGYTLPQPFQVFVVSSSNEANEDKGTVWQKQGHCAANSRRTWRSGWHVMCSATGVRLAVECSATRVARNRSSRRTSCVVKPLHIFKFEVHKFFGLIIVASADGLDDAVQTFRSKNRPGPVFKRAGSNAKSGQYSSTQKVVIQQNATPHGAVQLAATWAIYSHTND